MTMEYKYLHYVRLKRPVDAILEDRERRVLDLRQNLTLTQTATVFKVTRERIRQIQAKALKKLWRHSDQLLNNGIDDSED